MTLSLRDAKKKMLTKVEVTLRQADGTPILCELSLILHEDIVPVMAILTIEDVTLRRKTEQTMQRLAFRDMLTDLPNRTSLQADLELALDHWNSNATPFAVVMMDLDGFKPINDTYGHDAGDEVLKVVGARLVKQNRENDLAARLGGDEFVIVLHDCPDAGVATHIAQRFIEVVSQPIRSISTGITVQVGASAGVAHVSDGLALAEVILKNADSALYLAKTSGKNRVNVFIPGQTQETPH